MFTHTSTGHHIRYNSTTRSVTYLALFALPAFALFGLEGTDGLALESPEGSCTAGIAVVDLVDSAAGSKLDEAVLVGVDAVDVAFNGVSGAISIGRGYLWGFRRRGDKISFAAVLVGFENTA